MKKFLSFLVSSFLVLLVLPAFSQMQDVVWGGNRVGSVTIIGRSYNEVWAGVINLLLIEKFKPHGSIVKIEFMPVTIEKDAGLIVVNGFMFKGITSAGDSPMVTLAVSVLDTGTCIEVKCKGSGAGWTHRTVEKFFELLKESIFPGATVAKKSEEKK
jgi:hypothetical protein